MLLKIAEVILEEPEVKEAIQESIRTIGDVLMESMGHVGEFIKYGIKKEDKDIMGRIVSNLWTDDRKNNTQPRLPSPFPFPLSQTQKERRGDELKMAQDFLEQM